METAKAGIFPGWLYAFTKVGLERGWPAPTRTQFDAACGPDGPYLVGDPNTVVAKIFEPAPAGHDIAGLALDAGSVACPEPVSAGELVIFAEGQAATEVTATAAGASFVFGSAQKHPHDLVTGRYSLHTNAPGGSEPTFEKQGCLPL